MKKPCKNYHPESESDFLDKVRAEGGRITEQRKHIVRAILQFSSPFSADELHEVLDRQGIDQATVYRTLVTFTKMGFLSTVDFSDGRIRYESTAHGIQHHHHIVCTQCKSVQPVPSCDVGEKEKFLETMGYTGISHKLEFFGRCRACADQL